MWVHNVVESIVLQTCQYYFVDVWMRLRDTSHKYQCKEREKESFCYQERVFIECSKEYCSTSDPIETSFAPPSSGMYLCCDFAILGCLDKSCRGVWNDPL